ncbi:sulfatase [Bacteroidia bacterium]|nr:sulfatase [Bacteroidia bacterium]
MSKFRTLAPLFCLTGIGCTAVAPVDAASKKNDAAKGQPRPNVLVIMVDQMAAWTLGCYGGKEIGTPNIDLLAGEGCIATGFYANTPVSTPSRGAFQTGLYPQENGAYKNDEQIRQDVSTWAQVLREKGYQTGYAGKWHLDGNPKRPGWDIRGKDMGWSDRAAMYSFGHYKTIEYEPGDDHPRMSSDVTTVAANYPTDWFTSRALEFMGRHSRESFCFMLSIPDPHPAYLVRAPYSTMYPSSTMKLPATLTEEPKSDYYLYNETRIGAPDGKAKKTKSEYDQIVATLPQNKSQYFGMIKCIDDNVGRIITWLKDNSLYDNTIVVFTSDHGDMMGEHARMAKGVPFESAARVPFIVRYPAKIKGGTVCDCIASSIDFYPTILALAEVEQKEKVSGSSFETALTGKVQKGWKDRAFIRAYAASYPWVGVVTRDYKLIYGKNDVRGKALLIDRKKDPSESYNKVEDAAYATLASSLSQEIFDYCTAHNDPHLEWLKKRVK